MKQYNVFSLPLRRVTPLRSRPALRKPPSCLSLFIQDFFSNLSFHGFSYIAKSDQFFCERIFWAVLVIIASLAMALTGYDSWLSYRHPTVTTTVVTTRNECSNFPFPSLTLCDPSRVDWQRALNLTSSDFPKATNVSLEKVLLLLRALADMTFGDFDYMEILETDNFTSRDFRNIDLDVLLRKVLRPCSEVFNGQCWWRENFQDCCNLFELQKTDLGYCYSFNNDLSEMSRHYSWGYGKKGKKNYWVDWNGELRPRRASTSGPWTGLRLTVNVMAPEQIPTGTNITPGIMFYLQGSRTFPNTENQHIDPATFVELRAYGITLAATEKMHNLDIEDRSCLFLDDRSGWNGVYTEHNCLVECREYYVHAYCNCSPQFLFIKDNFTSYPPCDIKGLNCLQRHNLVFNTFLPLASKEFFKTLKEGMLCNCPQDCNSQQYMFDTSVSQTQNLSLISFDLHYKGQYHMLYRSDVMFGSMEFLVAIGGLAGLFLGGSLLSGAELIYFLTFRLFYHWRKSRKAKQRRVQFITPKY